MNEHPVLNKVLRIRRIRPEEVQPLIDEAAKDNHGVFRPTHVATKNGEVVGYLSIGSVPLVYTWMHTQKVTPRDSVNALVFVEDVLKHVGADCVCMPCWENSPYYPYMEEFGYLKLITTTMFAKTL